MNSSRLFSHYTAPPNSLSYTNGFPNWTASGLTSANHNNNAWFGLNLNLSHGAPSLSDFTNFLVSPTNTVTTDSSSLDSCRPQTPTHRPRRPQVITAAMSRRVANLPTSNRGGGVQLNNAALPQYIAREDSHGTDSTGSQDSILTQTPGPYHVAANAYQQQEQYYGTALQSQIGGPAPFATPDMSSSSAFQPMVNPSMTSLNPSSAAFVPPQDSYPAKNKASGYGPNPMNNTYDMRSARGSYPQGGSQVNAVPSYPASNVYTQGMSAVQTTGSQYPSAYGAATSSNPYDHYGQGTGVNEYHYQAQESNMAGYGASSSSQGYQMNGYSAGNGATYAPLQGQGWAAQYQERAQYPVQASQVPYINPSNANRGKPAYYNSKLNVAAQAYNPSVPSNLSTAPVRTVNPGHHAELANNEIQHGGAVQPPSRAPSRLNSASPRSKASTRPSSEEPSSSLPSLPTDDKSSAVGSPTPVSRPPHDFSSEPRNSKTPTLRSRRGQTVVPSTDPSHKQAMQSWLENVTVDSNGGSLGEKLKSPPPRMMDLFRAGGIDPATLTPSRSLSVNAVDPFTGPRNLTLPLIPANRFAQTGLSPLVGGPLLPPLPTQSGPLRRLIANGKPSASEALESINLPFVEYCRLAREDTWGVIKIKNIPYSVNRPEVLAFLGRNARIISEQDFEPVHIVMERVTSKTLDCYVEFVNFTEAVNAVNRFETNRTGGRGGRLGQRHVEVELASQEQLMKDLFPKAKNVTWHGSRPIIKPRDLSDPYNSGFQGFISKEELVMLVKHVEAPQRSPFSKDCPQRPFECLISTLLKYPWYMVDYITIEDRNHLHKVTLQLIDLLQDRIANDHENLNLTPMLLKRVWRAALKCPGFSPAMKDDIAWKCGVDDQFAGELGVPAYASFWKDLWTIGPKPGAPVDLVLYYAALIREAVGNKPELTLAQKAAKGHISTPPALFGELVKLVHLPKNRDDFETLTLAQCALAEWGAIEEALRRALTPALTAGPSA